MVTARNGQRSIRCWALPGRGLAHANAGLWDQLDLRGALSREVVLEPPSCVSFEVERGSASSLNRSWEVRLPVSALEKLLGRKRVRRFDRMVVSSGERWLVVRPRKADGTDPSGLVLNRFQRDLLGIDEGCLVQLSPVGRSPAASSRREPGGVFRHLVKVWRGFWFAIEVLARVVLRAPAMSMVVAWGTQGDDEQTARVDPKILPFLGVDEGDILLVSSGRAHAKVTAVARGVPPANGKQLVPVPSCRRPREVTGSGGVEPELMVSLPAPVRDDLGLFVGSVVVVRRCVTSVLGRSALALTTPIFTGVLALVALGRDDIDIGANRVTLVPLAVAALTLFLVLRSLRHAIPPRGRWP